MLTVSVINAQFIAPIGLYPQESKTLNQIGVDVSVSKATGIDDLPFIDYTEVYGLIKATILKHHKTLEAIIKDIYKALKELHPQCLLDIKVRKLHPPVSGQIDYTEVSFKDTGS
ncbi:MAG: dihydroneopterin aldolase [Sphingobacteriales bacterium]|nr:MAG: dihydroneopterin aldolase [Sphingobacteriales bacterium]